MHPKKHRSPPARPRGQNSAPWGVVPVDPREEPSKSEDDHGVGGKKRARSNQGRCSMPPRRASTRTKKKPRKYCFQEEVAATVFPGCVDPKNRGKRSVRPRGNKPASTSWALSLDGFQNLGTAASKLRSVGILRRDISKTEENTGAAVERNNAALVDGLAEVREANGAGANCTDEQMVVLPDTSLDIKGSNHSGDNVAAKLKVSHGADANSVVQAGVPETGTLPDIEESHGPVADALAKSDVQTNNSLKDRANRAAEFDSKTISGLNLDDGNFSFDLSSAESALASLYGESDRDVCIEFAVKLLMNETPLATEAAEIEEFFTQKIHGENSAKRQRQEEPSSSCSVWGNLQTDKLLFTSRCW